MKNSKLKSRMTKFIKRNIREISFILCHLIITLFIILIFSYINNKTNYLINLFKDSFDIILDISIVLITITMSFEFLIKQIYFNRISGRIISSQIKLYIYQVFVLISYIFLFSILSSNEKIMCTIYFSFLATMVSFFIKLCFDLEKYDLNKYIKKRVKKIILKIEQNNECEGELKSLNQIYMECVSKNEVNICLQIISSYNRFLTNYLYGKNKIILTNEFLNSNYENNFLEFYLKSVLPNDSLEVKRINFNIIGCMISLYENACKCGEDRLREKIELYITHLFLFKLNTLIDEYFKFFIINFLGNPFDENLLKFNQKIKFSLEFLKALLQEKRITDDSFLCGYFSEIIKTNNFSDSLKNNLNGFLDVIELMVFFNNNSSYLRLLETLDLYCLKMNCYDSIINFYDNIISYKEFYDKEITLLTWLNYFDGYINNNQERENYILKYYDLYFKIIKVSLDRIEILPIHMVPKLKIDYFSAIKKILNELLYLLSIKEKMSSLRQVFITLNDLCLELKISDLECQIEILDMYTVVLISLINCTDSKMISFVIDYYLDLITELDKNHLISQKLSNYIIEEIKNIIFEYIENNNIYATVFMKIFFDFVSREKDFHFMKTIQHDLYKDVFELGMKAIENGVDNFIKEVSNFIGWGVHEALSYGKYDLAKKYYKYGFNLFSTLVYLDYNNRVTVFVGTFFITILSYCYALDRNFTVLRFANERVRQFDAKMLNILYKSLKLRKDISYTWNDIFKVKFDEGLLHLCDKIHYEV